MTMPEFSRLFPLNSISTTARSVEISAEASECAALAKRFDLLAIDRLAAEAKLIREGEAILCSGQLSAQVTQSCVATSAPVSTALATDFSIRFVPNLADTSPADEIEIDSDDCDMIEHDGQAIDLGEAVAQTLLLALDPFPRAADAAQSLKAAGVISDDEVGNAAFSGLKALLGKS